MMKNRGFSYVVGLLALSLLMSAATAFLHDASRQKSWHHQSGHSSHIGHGTSLYMGMKVNIRIVGRKSGGDKWIDDGYGVYDKRLRPSGIQVETSWHKDNDALEKAVAGDRGKGHSIVLLDPRGNRHTSEKFTDNMYQWLESGGSRLSFVIGGADGLPQVLKDEHRIWISLSDLTFTHQFARLLLMEQIYRATEIRKGSGYHK